jgi:nucleoside-diphosphate-sugar epimerase
VADDLADPVVLVTGGGSGIGAACARLLASRGARVLIADVDEAAADKVAAGLARGGGTDGAGRGSAAVAVRADVSDPAVASIMGIVGSSRSAAYTAAKHASSSSFSPAPPRSSPAPCTRPTAATPRADGGQETVGQPADG